MNRPNYLYKILLIGGVFAIIFAEPVLAQRLGHGGGGQRGGGGGGGGRLGGGGGGTRNTRSINGGSVKSPDREIRNSNTDRNRDFSKRNNNNDRNIGHSLEIAQPNTHASFVVPEFIVETRYKPEVQLIVFVRNLQCIFHIALMVIAGENIFYAKNHVGLDACLDKKFLR